MGKCKDDNIPTCILDNKENLLSPYVSPPPSKLLEYIGELYFDSLECLTHGRVP